VLRAIHPGRTRGLAKQTAEINVTAFEADILQMARSTDLLAQNLGIVLCGASAFAQDDCRDELLEFWGLEASSAPVNPRPAQFVFRQQQITSPWTSSLERTGLPERSATAFFGDLLSTRLRRWTNPNQPSDVDQRDQTIRARAVQR
jgi:hypothetical protein